MPPSSHKPATQPFRPIHRPGFRARVASARSGSLTRPLQVSPASPSQQLSSQDRTSRRRAAPLASPLAASRRAAAAPRALRPQPRATCAFTSLRAATLSAEAAALPAISLGVKLDPFTPGDISYLLWLIMGYLLV